MLTPQPNPYPPQEKLRISYSSTKTFRACPRKFEFSKMYNLIREDQAGHAANVGNFIHEVIGTWLLTGSREKAFAYMVTHYPVNTYKNYSPNDPRSLEACYSTIQAIMDHPLWDRLSLAEVRVDGQLRKAIEVPFEIHLNVRIGNLPLSFIGYIDFIFWDSYLNKYIILDLKTTRIELLKQQAKFKFDEQMLPYALVLDTILGQQLREAPVTYLHAFIDLLAPDIKPLTYVKNTNDVKEWAHSLYILYVELDLYYKHRWFPRRSEACVGFGICQFSSHCESRDTEYLSTYFQQSGYIASTAPFHPWFTAQIKLA